MRRYGYDELVEAFAALDRDAGVSDFPYEFEDRLERVLPQLARLHVVVPERHDLALSKILRWAPSDRDDVRELHEAEPLDAGLVR